MTADYLEQLKVINLRTIVDPVLMACKTSRDEVAFLNWFPYRTKGNTPPPVAALRQAGREIVIPLVKVLDPSRIVFLGKRVGRVGYELLDAPRKYVVPRTIGDRHVCDAANEVLQKIRDEAG